MALVVRSLAATFYDGFHIEPHRHGWAQMVYAVSGVMSVRAGGTLWIVPPARAVWVPASAEHEIRALGELAMRTVYFAPALVGHLPGECCALDVSPLLRELLLAIVAVQLIDETDEPHMRLTAVAIDRIAEARTLPLQLPLPADPRAVRVSDRLRADPACDIELTDLAREAGASARTLQRLFVAETGLRFSEWRQRLRLLHGASLVGGGSSVTEAGLEAGYAGTSAFSAAFRRHFGFTPSQLA